MVAISGRHERVSCPQTLRLIPGPLTEWHDNGASDAVSHDYSEDTQYPCIHGSKLVFKGLVLGKERVKELTGWFCPQTPFYVLQAWGWEVSSRAGED